MRVNIYIYICVWKGWLRLQIWPCLVSIRSISGFFSAFPPEWDPEADLYEWSDYKMELLPYKWRDFSGPFFMAFRFGEVSPL